MKSSAMRAQGILISLLMTLSLWGCDSQTAKIEAIDSQTKTLLCTLNGSPMKMEIIQGSLDASLFYEGKELKVNLLEVKDFYQILMRFDPQIGQLKINKIGNELTQVKNGSEQITTCVAELKKS